MTQINGQQMDWTEYLVGEALLFGLLGRLIYTPPEGELLQQLVDEEVFLESPLGMEQADVVKGLEILQSWSAAVGPKVSPEEVEAIQSEHLRLFMGIGKVLAPPWESVYFSDEGLIFQEETLQVRSWYHRFGLQAERQYHEPDDHLGLELRFLAHLAKEALEAYTAPDRERFQELLMAQSEFLHSHLARWASLWADRAYEHAASDFYRGLALLVKGAVADLRTVLPAPAVEEK